MSKIQFDVDHTNGVTIDVANDVLPVWWMEVYPFRFKDKKEEIWLSPMTKAPTPTEMSKGQSDNTNNATKKFD